MRTFILITLLLSVTGSQAQTLLPGSFIDSRYRGGFANNIMLSDSAAKKKWFITRYSGISTSFSFFNGGNASVFSVPLALQLNHRLNKNLFAFAGVSAAPAYVNFTRAFMTADLNKMNLSNSFFKSSNLALYSRAELGLQYVNDERTFSISGSIGVERSSYPGTFYMQPNNRKINQVISQN